MGTSTAQFQGAALPAGVRAPNFTLRDLDGRTVSLDGLRGKVVVVGFLWSDCRTCLLVAQQVRGALDELGGATMAKTIFVSTSPGMDTRARAGRLLAETALTGRAAYLTGTERELKAVWREYHVAASPDRRTDGSSGRAAGSTTQDAEAGITVFLIDKDGMERVAYGVEQITPAALAHDIRLLEGE